MYRYYQKEILKCTLENNLYKPVMYKILVKDKNKIIDTKDKIVELNNKDIKENKENFYDNLKVNRLLDLFKNW